MKQLKEATRIAAVAAMVSCMAVVMPATAQGEASAAEEILALKTEEAQIAEWEKMLLAAQKNPTCYVNLFNNIPCAQEVAAEYQKYYDADMKCRELMFSFTDNHPDVIAAKKEVERSRQKFLDAVRRALLACRPMLEVARKRIANLHQKMKSEAEIMSEKLKLEQMRLEIERLKLERAKLEQMAK